MGRCSNKAKQRQDARTTQKPSVVVRKHADKMPHSLRETSTLSRLRRTSPTTPNPTSTPRPTTRPIPRLSRPQKPQQQQEPSPPHEIQKLHRMSIIVNTLQRTQINLKNELQKKKRLIASKHAFKPHSASIHEQFSDFSRSACMGGKGLKGPAFTGFSKFTFLVFLSSSSVSSLWRVLVLQTLRLNTSMTSVGFLAACICTNPSLA